MNDLRALLSELRQRSIKLGLNGDDIEVLSYDKKLTDDIIARIRSYKEQLKIHLVAESQRNTAISSQEIEVVPVSDSYAVSAAQYRMWITSQYKDGLVAYNTPGKIKLEGEYDVSLLQKAIREVVCRHEILRTVFRLGIDEEIRQIVMPPEHVEFVLAFENLLNKSNAEEHIEIYIREDANLAFDLEVGPLFRSKLFQVGKNSFVLYFNLHHIISDGWSLDILFRDVHEIYQAYFKNVQHNLPDLKIQYKDYAAWHNQFLESNEIAETKNFWSTLLDGELPVLKLPGEKNRPLLKTFKGSGWRLFLKDSEVSNLKDFVRQNGGSLFMHLIASWKVLLYRYSGQEDFIVGTPIAARQHHDLRDQIGFYMNLLPIRSQLQKDMTYQDFYSHLKGIMLKAYEYQMYPFDQILKDLDIQRVASRSPIFDISATFHNTSGLNQKAEIDSFDIHPIHVAHSRYDMDINYSEWSDGLQIDLIFNPDVLDETTVHQMLADYQNLFVAVTQNPFESLGSIEFLQKEDQQKIFLFNETRVDYQRETVLEMFQDQLLKNSNQEVVMCEGKSFTYKELDELSNQFAHFLSKAQGINAGDIVAIQLERSEWVIISILGILKLGAAYLPIDSTYPANRTEFMQEDCKSKFCITQSQLGELAECLKSYSADSLAVIVKPADIAYIIYTSGSTGKPKGVRVSHKGLSNYLNWSRAFYLNENTSAIGLFSSLSFDLTVTSIFLPLVSNLKLEIFRSEDIAEVLKSYMRGDQSLDIIKLTPSHILLLNELGLRSTSVSAVIVGGEPLKQVHVKILRALNPQLKIYNEYGPTEATVGCTVSLVNEKDTIHVGRPIANCKIYVLNDSLKLQPMGVVGEIYIGGDGLADGYVNRDALNKEVFIDNPFVVGEKIYKTGDFGKWLNGGQLVLAGRKDEQLKIKGLRVELGEIEYALELHTYVMESAVLQKETATGEKHLVAYIKASNEIDPSDLHTFLVERLPVQVIPTEFIFVKELPLTSNGKKNKSELLKIEGEHIPGPEYVAPRNEKEEILIATCSRILSNHRLSMKDNYFQLGGDSIKSIQLVSKLRQNGYLIKAEQILRNPILEKIAEHMIFGKSEISQEEVKGEIPLTPIQHYFFKDAGILNVDYYNQSIVLKSKKHLDKEIIQKCAWNIVKHHDALRIKYSVEDQIQSNDVWSPASTAVQFFDLSGDTDPQARFRQMSQKLQSDFSLSYGPLFRIGHFRLPDADKIAIVIHHFVVDGVSWRILLEDFLALYKQGLSGVEFQLPLKTDSFKTWSLALTNKHTLFEGERSYWESIKGDNLFGSLQPPISTNFNQPNSFSFRLNKEETIAVRGTVNKRFNTEINDILLTALGVAMNQVFKSNKTLLKMEGHGREDVLKGIDISRTVGWFTSMYPFLLQVSSMDLMTELVRVKELLRNVPNKGIGYGVLRYLSEKGLSDVEYDLSFNFLGEFETYKEEPNALLEISNENIGPDLDTSNKLLEAIHVSGMIVNGELNISFEFDKRIHADQAEKLSLHVKESLLTLKNELTGNGINYVTPSDLTYKKLSIQDLVEMNPDGSIVDIYELAPLQEGIYYHWVKDRLSDLYFEQLSYTVHSRELQEVHIQQAYSKLVERHAIIRTGFTQKYGDVPLQIVRKSVAPAYEYFRLDEGLNDLQIAESIEQKRLDDREKGFKPTDKSLMRLCVIERRKGEFEFIWSHHHILMDGWCMTILVNEFYEILNGCWSGVDVRLDDPVLYSGYIAWLRGVNRGAAEVFWQDYLKGYENNARIPFQKDRTSRSGYEGRYESYILNSSLEKEIETICKDLSLTLNTFIQTAWGVLLSRYNNVNDVVFGAVTSGRPGELPGVEKIVGLFINTIPVRITYQEEDTVEKLLLRAQERAIAMANHQFISLTEIQATNELGTNLFNHYLVFENYPVEESLAEGIDRDDLLEMELKSFSSYERNHFDSSLVIIPTNKGLEMRFRYNQSLIRQDSVNLILRQLEEVLNQFSDSKKTMIKDLQLAHLSENEMPYPDFVLSPSLKDKTVLDFFEERVLINPEAVALEFEKTVFSYKTLNERVNKLARYIVDKQDVKPDDFVGINIDRTHQMIIVILSIIKAGCVYVPVDPLYPESRKERILKNANCRLIVTEDLLKEFDSLEHDFSGDNLGIRREMKDDIYMLFTSGSTGEPKGVLVSNGALSDYVIGIQDKIDLEACMSFGLLSTIAADLGNTVLFPSLISGKRLRVFSEIELRSPELASKISVDCIKITPSHWSSLQGKDSRFVPNKVLIFGGEELLDETIAKVLDSGFAGRIYNHYGPTETTVGKLATEISSNDHYRITLGTSIGENKVYLLDSGLNICPPGIPGEICISGRGLATAYYNDVEFTNKKFVQNPFEEKERLYKTGDYGRWTADGKIEFIGRVDNQVKIRGYRIELKEVERHILQFTGISDAAVKLIKNEQDDSELLVAYFIANVLLNGTDIRSNLMTLLPEYMVPAHFVQLEKLPLTPNGKLDSRALPNLSDILAGGGLVYTAPENEIQKRLVEIWEEILGRERIGIDDNFFDLGGQSIKAITIIMKIQKEYKMGLSIQQLFQNPTIKNIAHSIELVHTSRNIDIASIKKTIEL